ncbi:MAG: radical SAM protein [Chitinophagales bacterium]
MQLTATTSPEKQAIQSLPAFKIMTSALLPKMISGARQKFIKWMMWNTIFIVALKKFRNPFTAFQRLKQLKNLRDQYRNQHPPVKYSVIHDRYFVNYNTPAWPSKAFDRYVTHLFNRADDDQHISLNTVVFAITKKCGFQCEHCCEWENLNKPEVLSKEDLLLIIRRFQQLGVSQVQLSGGEPLNRFHDVLFLLDNVSSGTDFWLYTTGYQLTAEKARLLKKYGLRGITISVDNCDEEAHDKFRGKKGSYQRALQAAQYAGQAGLAVCFSLCATKQFISAENLMRYAEVAKNAGASFIQVLEPKAVGHYAGHDVILSGHHQKMLEEFSEKLNYETAYSSYPIITYHGHYSRRIGCSGSAKDYLYVDTDGDIHNCPFCQRKLFSALNGSLIDHIAEMKRKGCSLYNICSTVK